MVQKLTNYGLFCTHGPRTQDFQHRGDLCARRTAAGVDMSARACAHGLRVFFGQWRPYSSNMVLPLSIPAQRRGLRSVGRPVVDLRSDTITQPCAEMRSAMSRAEVGDDVYGEDPTVKTLQEHVATLFGKEDAVLLPSGTMANLACILAHTARGDQVILSRHSHIYNWEQGNVSSLAGCTMTPIETRSDGTCALEDLCDAVFYDDPHMPRSRLVCLENSHGGHAGTAVPAAFAASVSSMCAERGLLLHIDGARILNAALALQISEIRWAFVHLHVNQDVHRHPCMTSTLKVAMTALYTTHTHTHSIRSTSGTCPPS
jgi:hypothetical protein